MRRRYREPSVRERIGVTQEEFALMLQTSESAVSMAEINQRSLPGNTSIIVGLMEICLQKKEEAAATTAILAQQKQEAIASFKKRSEECDFLIEREERKLAKLKLQFEYCINALQVAGNIQDTAATLFADKAGVIPYLGWTDYLHHLTLPKLKPCGISVQQYAMLKINTLKYEKEQLAVMIDELEAGAMR